MVDTSFMQEKYTVDTLVDHYLADIKALRYKGMPAQEEDQLKRYYQAAKCYKGLGVKDIAQFALTFGRSQSGKVPLMVKALPTLLGNRVHHPLPVDLAYAKILLAYTLAFQSYKSNLKQWYLRFLLNSRFSPVFRLAEREILYVIENTQNKIQLYSQNNDYNDDLEDLF